MVFLLYVCLLVDSGITFVFLFSYFNVIWFLILLSDAGWRGDDFSELLG